MTFMELDKVPTLWQIDFHAIFNKANPILRIRTVCHGILYDFFKLFEHILINTRKINE